MTVAELIHKLSEMPPDIEIMQQSNGICEPRELRVWQKDIYQNHWPDEQPTWETFECKHTRQNNKAVFLR